MADPAKKDDKPKFSKTIDDVLKYIRSGVSEDHHKQLAAWEKYTDDQHQAHLSENVIAESIDKAYYAMKENLSKVLGAQDAKIWQKSSEDTKKKLKLAMLQYLEPFFKSQLQLELKHLGKDLTDEQKADHLIELFDRYTLTGQQRDQQGRPMKGLADIIEAYSKEDEGKTVLDFIVDFRKETHQHKGRVLSYLNNQANLTYISTLPPGALGDYGITQFDKLGYHFKDDVTKAEYLRKQPQEQLEYIKALRQDNKAKKEKKDLYSQLGLVPAKGK
jgi:hypothetical protein